MKVNERQKTKLLGPIIDYFGGYLTQKTIAIWGLSFKPDTDDIREAPALYMIEHLLSAGANLRVFDPEAMDNVKKQKNYPIEFCNGQYEAIDGADALLICTEWGEFRNPDFARMSSLLKGNVIFDGRNLYETAKMRELGFYYHSIGREVVKS